MVDLRIESGARVDLAAAADPAAKNGPRTFTMLAYSGDEVRLWGERMVFDLASMTEAGQSVPILEHHDPRLIAGHSTKIENDRKALKIAGQLAAVTAAGQEVAALSDSGFPWQASVGLDAPRFEYCEPGESVECNGRTFTGPIAIARGCVLREASFVPLGADSKTSAVALADGADVKGRIARKERPTMADQNPKPTADDAVAAERARVREIRAAFPKDADFAIEHIDRGSSPLEARAAYAVRLEAKLEDERKLSEKRSADHAKELEAARNASKNPPLNIGAGRTAGDQGTAVERWNAALSQRISEGRSRRDAVSDCVRANPQLHREMLTEVNPRAAYVPASVQA